ncbi:MAG: hypothetical protein OXN21_02945 [Chloroflexota bacterium]|nr:hypothetical protein [Chloroflexota bacterium]
MPVNTRLSFAISTLPLLVAGVVVGAIGVVALWPQSPEMATAVGLALFLISALGGRLAVEIVVGLTRLFVAVYEIQQNAVENAVSLTEKKVDDIIRLSERDPRFGYSDFQAFPRFVPRNPLVQSARRTAWRVCWYTYPVGLVFTLITGCTALVFEFVGIGYPMTVLAAGAGFTLAAMLVAFGEPLLGNWQILRKCRRMLRATHYVEKRLDRGERGNV